MGLLSDVNDKITRAQAEGKVKQMHEDAKQKAAEEAAKKAQQHEEDKQQGMI
jgi:vacuolar-type H+-ATPase subunit E/Vma4